MSPAMDVQNNNIELMTEVGRTHFAVSAVRRVGDGRALTPTDVIPLLSTIPMPH